MVVRRAPDAQPFATPAETLNEVTKVFIPHQKPSETSDNHFGSSTEAEKLLQGWFTFPPGTTGAKQRGHPFLGH